jgi:hypothetical protein
LGWVCGLGVRTGPLAALHGVRSGVVRVQLC